MQDETEHIYSLILKKWAYRMLQGSILRIEYTFTIKIILKFLGAGLIFNGIL